jgi:basic membrane lipoprotein Med (substrate-binding protein (PBP1-ABC) superfamily)
MMMFVAMVASACGVSTSAAKAPSTKHLSSKTLQTGWIYDGSIHDHGYDEQFAQAMVYLEHTMGIKASYVQNEPYTSQWTTTDLSMAAAGAKMLFDPGDGGSLFYKACGALPKVACVEANGVTPFPSKNIATVYSKNWLVSYLEGEAAGLLSKNGTIGYLAAFPNTPAPVMETLNALVLGCQATHPGCRALVDYVNSWYNPPVETADLNSLVDAGAQVLASTQNDPTTVEVAQKRGVWGIANWITSDAVGVADGPDAFVTGQMLNYGPLLAKLAKDYEGGRFPGGSVNLLGFHSGMSLAKWGPKVPSAVRTKVDATYKQMLAGKNVFCGPIYSNTNALMIRSGKCMSTMQIYEHWNWYVRGVVVSK